MTGVEKSKLPHPFFCISLIMNQPNLEQIAAQLQSPQVKERVLAMIELQKETVSAQVALPLIKQALTDTHVQIRGMAAFALGIKPTPENLAILVSILATDEDHNMRAIAAGALGYLEDKQAIDSLRHAFYEDTHWLVQFSAAIALGNLKDAQAQAVLLEALASPTLLLQEAAIMALGEIGAVEAIDQLLPFAHSADWMLRKRLAEALGNLPHPQSQIILNKLKTDSNPQVAEAARQSLQDLEKA
jgi:HEAT repeat protein